MSCLSSLSRFAMEISNFSWPPFQTESLLAIISKVRRYINLHIYIYMEEYMGQDTWPRWVILLSHSWWTVM